MSHLDPTTYRCEDCDEPLDSVRVTQVWDRYRARGVEDPAGWPIWCEDCE